MQTPSLSIIVAAFNEEETNTNKGEKGNAELNEVEEEDFDLSQYINFNDAEIMQESGEAGEQNC